MKLKRAFTVFLLVGTIQQSSAETPAPQSSPDIDIKKFSLRKSKSGKDSAEVLASFENVGHKTEITYSLVLIKMGWEISNIKYADGRNLVAVLGGK